MTGGGTTRGSYAKTAERRKLIVQAGVEVFSSGYRSGSIREIAERVGMSQAGLLHHFASKSALLEAVLVERDEQAGSMIAADPVDGIHTIRGLIALTEHNTTIPGLVELYCVLSAEATSADHPAHHYFTRRYDSTVTVVRQAFEQMAARGELVEGVEPTVTAQNLLALMDGLQVQWLLDRESLSMVENVRQYLRPLFTIEL